VTPDASRTPLTMAKVLQIGLLIYLFAYLTSAAFYDVGPYIVVGVALAMKRLYGVEIEERAKLAYPDGSEREIESTLREKTIL